jgi:hypothetical protein
MPPHLSEWAELSSTPAEESRPLLEGIEEAAKNRFSTPQTPSLTTQALIAFQSLGTKKRKADLPTKPEERMASPGDPIKYLENAMEHINKARHADLGPYEKPLQKALWIIERIIFKKENKLKKKEKLNGSVREQFNWIHNHLHQIKANL